MPKLVDRPPSDRLIRSHRTKQLLQMEAAQTVVVPQAEWGGRTANGERRAWLSVIEHHRWTRHFELRVRGNTLFVTCVRSVV